MIGDDSNLALSVTLNGSCCGAAHDRQRAKSCSDAQKPGQAKSGNRETTGLLVQLAVPLNDTVPVAMTRLDGRRTEWRNRACCSIISVRSD